MFTRLNADVLMPLMALGAEIKITCNEQLENHWGDLRIRGIVPQGEVEIIVLNHREYFPMSVIGVTTALSWAESQVDDFKSGS